MRYLIVLLCFISGSLNAQNFLHGFIKDKLTNEPLIGASVNITGTNTGVATNNSGYFVLHVQDTLPINLTIRYIGYKTVAVKLNA
jgi:phosphatidate phosphatase APP1